MAPGARKYQVKLTSGRVLGPLDMERIRKLILKKQILGTELARDDKHGEWKNIAEYPELLTLIMAHAQGQLEKKPLKPPENTRSSTVPLVLPGATEVFRGTKTLKPLPSLKSITGAEPEAGKGKNVPDLAAADIVTVPVEGLSKVGIKPGEQPEAPAAKEEEDLDKTEIGVLEDENMEPTEIYSPATRVDLREEEPEEPDTFARLPVPRRISEEPTVVFQGVRNIPQFLRVKKKKPGFFEKVKVLAAAICLGAVLYQLFLSEPDANKEIMKRQPIRPHLPTYIPGNPDPAKSMKIYNQALHFYLLDNVVGYKKAADLLQLSASYDAGNVKAHAILASTYLNLIDSSNKDENYFSTISKFIDLSRARGVDLPETVIADVEYFITVNKPEAAENRVAEYSRSHEKSLEMFYYLALAYYHRGELALAARALAQIPDNKAFSAKIFYLHGRVAEKLEDYDTALREYSKAIQFNPSHAKSHLRIASIMNQKGTLKEAQTHLKYILDNPTTLSPKSLAEGYYLNTLYAEQKLDFDHAIFYVERAVRLDRDNHEYLLELYTLRAKEGDSSQQMRSEARMFYFLGEGEKLLKEGKYQDALVQFLQARKVNNESPVPLVKIGDMFTYLHDLANARLNYKMAAQRAPLNITIWSKYMGVLIESYEWDEAQQAMDKFRKLPVNQSAIDKLAADLYQKQGKIVEAQMLYKKAMAREAIDPEVYIAYAKSLMSSKAFKDAPFFFALALRFDPLNIDAIVGTAKCIAATESIERAVSMLQDELQKGSGAKAELLAAIAEFQIQKGDYDKAQQNIDLAMKANLDYALPWKLQAEIFMSKESVDRNALDKALAAYKSYSDRNSSDPSGYMERYKIFVRKTQYERASDELDKIYGVFPKYPSLHYYKGVLHSLMGNNKGAVEEYTLEIKNNPNNILAILALGRVLLEANQANDALNMFVKAMQIAPQNSEAKQLAGYANYLMKNYSGAVALYQAALAYDKANPMIYKRMGLAYRDMGNNESAAEAFRKYLEMEPDAPDREVFERFR